MPIQGKRVQRKGSERINDGRGIRRQRTHQRADEMQRPGIVCGAIGDFQDQVVLQVVEAKSSFQNHNWKRRVSPLPTVISGACISLRRRQREVQVLRGLFPPRCGPPSASWTCAYGTRDWPGVAIRVKGQPPEPVSRAVDTSRSSAVWLLSCAAHYGEHCASLPEHTPKVNAAGYSGNEPCFARYYR